MQGKLLVLQRGRPYICLYQCTLYQMCFPCLSGRSLQDQWYRWAFYTGYDFGEGWNMLRMSGKDHSGGWILLLFYRLKVWHKKPIDMLFIFLSGSQLSLVACSCRRLRPHELFPIQVSMVVGVILLQLTFGQSCQWDFLSVVSDSPRKHSLTANSLTLRL